LGIGAPELLLQNHDLSGFTSGYEELDVWLHKQALKSQSRNNARVYVVSDTDIERVVGYYAVAMGSVQRNDAINPLKRNSPNPIPMVVLGRLAVHSEYQGLGIGAGLLKDCVLRSVDAMNSIGGAGILVHAIDDSARSFYTKFGFSESPFDSLTLMARISDIEATLSK
jgi:predicted N-acetyltransferase YhbS